jgi:hypothetical protein
LFFDRLCSESDSEVDLDRIVWIPARHRRRRSSLAGAGKRRAGNWNEGLILTDTAKAARRSQPPGSPLLLEQFQDELRVLVGDRQRLDAELLLRLERLQLGRRRIHVRIDHARNALGIVGHQGGVER